MDGNWLFAQNCDFVLSVASLSQLPGSTLPEIAFVGRSNVGKSSLVNALTGRNTLAKTSNTPGRTQHLNFFDLAGKLMLVDLPGYGYAKVPKTKVEQWTRMLKTYLVGRTQLMRVCLLIDARHGIKDSDEIMMDLLDKTAVNYQIILTKSDKIIQRNCATVLELIHQKIAKRPAAYPDVILTSAETKDGVEALRASLAAFVDISRGG